MNLKQNAAQQILQIANEARVKGQLTNQAAKRIIEIVKN
jgi:hypothetical protein